MKTTIEIPEPLYKKAKIRAVETGQTLRQIVVASLERELAGPGTTGEPKPSYWASRTLLPEFREYWESGELSGGTDSTEIVSEDRSSRDDACAR